MSDSPSEEFRTGPDDSAAFGTIPHSSESFRSVQNTSERKDDHKLTVREVARMFEAGGVARTERSITNWCQPNKQGIPRLDAYFDSNERKYFITPRSVEIAIQEEQSKDRTRSTAIPLTQETDSEGIPKASAGGEKSDPDEVERLHREVLDLKILNQGKDYYINKLQEERQQFADERQGFIENLMKFNRRVGQLETRLGITAPTESLETLEQEDDFDTTVSE